MGSVSDRQIRGKRGGREEREREREREEKRREREREEKRREEKRREEKRREERKGGCQPSSLYYKGLGSTGIKKFGFSSFSAFPNQSQSPVLRTTR
jgi:hypothetical protein